jgi:hypothetical protein
MARAWYWSRISETGIPIRANGRADTQEGLVGHRYLVAVHFDKADLESLLGDLHAREPCWVDDEGGMTSRAESSGVSKVPCGAGFPTGSPDWPRSGSGGMTTWANTGLNVRITNPILGLILEYQGTFCQPIDSCPPAGRDTFRSSSPAPDARSPNIVTFALRFCCLNCRLVASLRIAG